MMYEVLTWPGDAVVSLTKSLLSQSLSSGGETSHKHKQNIYMLEAIIAREKVIRIQ